MRLISSLLFPDFTIEPKSVVVRKGSPAILNCQTNIQTKDIVIQWKKGHRTLWIHNYTSKPYQLQKNHSLFFPSVGIGDEDVYFCSAHQRSTTETIYSRLPAHITLACKYDNKLEHATICRARFVFWHMRNTVDAQGCPDLFGGPGETFFWGPSSPQSSKFDR